MNWNKFRDEQLRIQARLHQTREELAMVQAALAVHRLLSGLGIHVEGR